MNLDDYLNLLRDNCEPEPTEAPSAETLPKSVPSTANDSRKQIECPVHGQYDARWVRLGPGCPPMMGWAHCPRCKAEWDEGSRRDEARLRTYLPGEPRWSRK